MAEQKQKQKFTEKHAELWKFIKFSIAGGLSSVIELIVNTICVTLIFNSMNYAPESGVLAYIFDLLKLDNMGVFFSYMISTTVGYTIAFIINRKTTFKADSNVALSATLYFIMVVFTIFANAFIGVYLTKFFNSFWEQSVIRDIVIKAIGMAIPTLWTYPLNRFVIHRHKKPVEGEEAKATEEATEIAEATTEAPAAKVAETADTTEK